MKNTTTNTAGSSEQQNFFNISRRQALLGSGAAAVAAFASGAASAKHLSPKQNPTAIGEEITSFYGKYQSGIATNAQNNVIFAALDFELGQDRGRIIDLMRIWTDDAARLSEGRPALADSDPELAFSPGNLSFTFGFGSKVFDIAGLEDERPYWLKSMDYFGVEDPVGGSFSGGDIFVQICGNHELAMSHSFRMLVKDARGFAKVRWVQRGFRSAVGVLREKQTMRNLMGQLDGSRNLVPGSSDFEDLVWSGSDNPGWLRYGSSVVLRRIAMDLDTWDELDRGAREQIVGRRISDGAPLGGVGEFDEPDLGLEKNGLKVIADFAHIRRARSDNLVERFFRRGYNYDDVDGAGLLFCSYQADVVKQFVPIQKRLDELDLLNKWVTTVGSSVFAILPGCEAGGYLGESLLGV